MFIFIFGVVLGAVPQYLKLILLASSEGISLVSLALMNVSNLTATLNIFILHFEQIKQCVKQNAPEYSFDACQASLLTFYYTLVYTLLWFPLPAGRTLLFQSRKSEVCGVVQTQRQHAWQGLLAHLVPCAILAAPVLKMAASSGACHEYEAYALLLGVVNAIRGSDSVSAPGLRELVLDGKRFAVVPAAAAEHRRRRGGDGAEGGDARGREHVVPAPGGSLVGDCHRADEPVPRHARRQRAFEAEKTGRNPEERTTIRGRRRAGGMWRAGRRRR